MNRVLGQLEPLKAALFLPSATAPAIVPNPEQATALIGGIIRKVSFAKMHLDLLRGVDWARVDGVGRRSVGGSPEHLTIPLDDARLVLEHSGAVIDHVFLAFDGLTAALINMTDTLGRFINLVYRLGIDPKRASLIAVRDQCSRSSSLGTVLHDPTNTEWLKRVRDMRGRCQHADVESVLKSDSGSYVRRRQPCVDSSYCWWVPAADTFILRYAQDATDAAANSMATAISAILARPHDPIS